MNKTGVTPVQIAIRVIIIIVMLIIIFFVALVMIRLVPKALTSLSSIKDIFVIKERIVATVAPNKISSETHTTLTYKQEGSSSIGYYTLSYSCDPAVHLDLAIGPNRNVLKCNEPFTLNQATSSRNNQTIDLIGVSSASSTDQKITLTIAHKNASTTLSSINLPLTITPFKKDTAFQPTNTSTSTPYVTSPTYPASTTTKPSTSSIYSHASTGNGQRTYTTPAHLVATFLSGSVDANNRTTTQFTVTNTGGRSSGTWYFRATLPTSNQYAHYSSPAQSSIPPQGRSVLTLAFDNTLPGSHTMTVIINGVSTTLTIVGNGANGNTGDNNVSDLYIKSVVTGTVDLNGNFCGVTNCFGTTRQAIRIVVGNNGGRATGAWSFRTAFDNSSNGSNGSNSGTLPSLAGYQEKAFIVGFDSLPSNYLTVTLDPNNQVYESNEGNNTQSLNLWSN